MHSPRSRRFASHRRKLSLSCFIAFGIALSGLAGYLAAKRPSLPVARQGWAAPSAATPTPPQPVLRSPEASSQARPFQGRVLGAASRRALVWASVWSGANDTLTDGDGRFSLDTPAGSPLALLVKRPGYERKRVSLVGAETTVQLRPQTIKAAYLTYYGVGERRIRERVLDLVARTELNAVVIDVKGDRGLIPYRTEGPAALEAGAQGPVIIKDFDALLASLKAQGIYTIARIVVFKDNVLANHRRDLAIIDTRTGRPWIDNEKLAWVDPFREEVWNYAIATAKEAAAKGFDEIQFDYVRFPTDGRLSAARYSRPNNPASRLPTIAAFLAKARRELGPTGVYIAADLFGYTAFNTNDTDIGQRIEELAPHLDYICPMV